jgi:amyloid beta precursor protein binding protein 1
VQDLKSRIKPISIPIAPNSADATVGSPLSDHQSNGVSASIGTIDDDTVSLFCRNACHLQLISSPSLREEYSKPHPAWMRELSVESSDGNEMHHAYAIYVLFRAIELFNHVYRRWPGEHATEVEGDEPQLRILVRDVIRSMSLGCNLSQFESWTSNLSRHGEGSVYNTEEPHGLHCNTGSSTPVTMPTVNLDDWVQELYVPHFHPHFYTFAAAYNFRQRLTLVKCSVRAGSSELHSIASYMGGVTAQEVIKLITGQYIPMGGVYVYNGIHSTSHALKFSTV